MFHIGEQGEIQCLTPFFAPHRPSLWRASRSILHRDPTCEHCSGADFDFPDGSSHTRATLQFVDFTDWRDGPREHTLDLAVSAFASSVQVFDDAEAYQQAQTDPANEGFSLAEEAFLPVGMFGPAERPMEEAACALFSGTIVQHEVLRNEHFDQRFHRLQVATLPGPIDVLYSVREGQAAPRVEGLAQVQAWLVGRTGAGRHGDPWG